MEKYKGKASAFYWWKTRTSPEFALEVLKRTVMLFFTLKTHESTGTVRPGKGDFDLVFSDIVLPTCRGSGCSRS